MTIKISKNLDDIKSGGIGMFTSRQIIYGLLTLAVVVLVDGILTGVMGLNSNIGGFAGLICGLPLGYVGFFKKNGMNLQEYHLAKKSINNMKPLFYVSTETEALDERTKETSNSGTIKKDGITQAIIRMMKRSDRHGEGK